LKYIQNGECNEPIYFNGPYSLFVFQMFGGLAVLLECLNKRNAIIVSMSMSVSKNKIEKNIATEKRTTQSLV
jgi:hypothetical protein